MTNKTDLKVGQLWKNKKSGRVIRITDVNQGNISWESVTDMAGPREGLRWCGYWTQTFEPYESSQDGDMGSVPNIKGEAVMTEEKKSKADAWAEHLRILDQHGWSDFNLAPIKDSDCQYFLDVETLA